MCSNDEHARPANMKNVCLIFVLPFSCFAVFFLAKLEMQK